MALIPCPRCSLRCEAPDVCEGYGLKCPRCGYQFKIPRMRIPQPPPARPKSVSPPQHKRLLLAGIAAVLTVAAIGTATYFVFFNGSPEDKPEASPQLTQGPLDTRSADDVDREARAKKKQDETLAAKLKAEELAKKKEEAARLAREEERRRKAEEKRILEAKLEREREERLAREEKERKEKLAKEEAAKLLFEKRNPKLSATVEEVDASPDKFIGKRLFFDDVKIKATAIEKSKELDRYTVGVTSTKGRYYSRVVLGGLFFSTSDAVAAELLKELNTLDGFYKLRLFCEVRQYEKKGGGKLLPEGYIFKIEIYNALGRLTHKWEEPE